MDQPTERKRIALQEWAHHRFEAKQYDVLLQRVTERRWYELHRTYNPTLERYAESLDLALKTPLASGAEFLNHLLVSLLRTTIHSLVTELPDAAVQSMGRNGMFQEAGFYALQRLDPSSRCKALRIVAGEQIRGGDRISACDTLAIARSNASDIADPVQQIDELCGVAESFKETNNPATASEVLKQAAALLDQLPPIGLFRRTRRGNTGWKSFRQRYKSEVESTTNEGRWLYARACIVLTSPNLMGTPESQEAIKEITRLFERRTGYIGEAFSEIIRSIGLFEQHLYLVSLARWKGFRLIQ